MIPKLVENLSTNDIIAKPVYNSSAQILLNKGLKFQPRFIKKLQEIKIRKVYVEQPGTEDIECQDIISDELRINSIKLMTKELKKTQTTKTPKLNKAEIEKTAYNIVDELIAKYRVLFVNNVDIKSFENYTAAHCVNTCILASIIAIKSGFLRNEIYDLAVGTLVHDIGKAKIPDEILDKPGRLTKEEFEIVKTHTTEGYNILSANDFRPTITAIAYQHHEKVNGEGYPNSSKKHKIFKYAKIAAIVDVFDALTSDRVYKRAMLPSMALSVVQKSSGTHFDEGYTDTFYKSIAIYPVGTIVKLNSGQKGIVSNIDTEYLNSPTVRILKAKKEFLKEPFEIDLSKDKTVKIMEVLDEL